MKKTTTEQTTVETPVENTITELKAYAFDVSVEIDRLVNIRNAVLANINDKQQKEAEVSN